VLKRLCPGLVLLLMTASPAFAWGTVAHRYIMGRAIDLLPPDIKPFFEHYRTELVVRVIDPDTYRLVGWDDAPNHFVDFGVKEYGAYPFTELPREYDAALEKFGMATLRKNGLLPWRFQEEFGNLRRAFEGFARKNPFAPTDVVLFTAVAAHYIEDATQPLHASDNFDGQLTGNNGLHARFETALFERYTSRFKITPAPPKPMTNPRDTAFDTLVAGNQLVPALLAADKAAINNNDTYDDAYFERFFQSAGPILERQVASAITATASLIIGAWEQAGKPQLTIEFPPAVQKVRKPSN
jgi:hypothetical protein